MADRVFKGHLHCTNSIKEQNERAFPEASEEFNEAHAGGLVPFDLMTSVTQAKDFESKMINGDLWLSGDEVWIRIEKNGTIEIGIAGV